LQDDEEFAVKADFLNFESSSASALDSGQITPYSKQLSKQHSTMFSESLQLKGIQELITISQVFIKYIGTNYMFVT